MNLWGSYVDELTVIAPVLNRNISEIDLPYHFENIQLKRIPSISFVSFFQLIRSIVFVPVIFYVILKEMYKTDHIHLRCPGNIGLIGCIAQICFRKKIKTTKYAGNWDPNSKQPFSYRLQKWLLSNTFLTRNMQVLVYGNWTGQTRNIKPFFTATYPKCKAFSNRLISNIQPSRFIFVGSLSSGKRPLYAVKLVEALYKKGIDCSLDLYGEGVERSCIESYIEVNQLKNRMRLHGNHPSEIIENVYKKSHFLILPSTSEGWPKVIAEAMFWGSIPIATEVSCVPWMLGNGDRGVLIEMDLDRDVTKVLSLLIQKEKLDDIRTKAQNWSQNYTLDTFECEIVKLLSK